MERIETFLSGVSHVAIAGHVKPDGDCVGSCVGLYLYLTENYPQLAVDLYLQETREVFSFLKDYDKHKTSCAGNASCDLCILLDISSRERIGVAGKLAERTEKTLCIDHHITNNDSFTWKFNEPFASSASELVYRFLDPEKISKACAEALYMGIAHDTGVFQYPGTTPETMRIAASLMEKGIEFSRILDDTYFKKSYAENQIMARALLESFTRADGRLIFSVVSMEMMHFYGVQPKDLEGIVNQLRNTAGVEAAVFLYETGPRCYKASLRSRASVDVSTVAAAFGGGGHRRAAGCMLKGTQAEVTGRIADALQAQLAG